VSNARARCIFKLEAATGLFRRKLAGDRYVVDTFDELIKDGALEVPDMFVLDASLFDTGDMLLEVSIITSSGKGRFLKKVYTIINVMIISNTSKPGISKRSKSLLNRFDGAVDKVDKLGLVFVGEMVFISNVNVCICGGCFCRFFFY
jgi:hypothetical protein